MLRYVVDDYNILNTTYSTNVIIPLSVLENTAAKGVTPSLSATSRDDGECSERKQVTKKLYKQVADKTVHHTISLLSSEASLNSSQIMNKI